MTGPLQPAADAAPDARTAPSREACAEALAASRAFATSDDGIAWRQVVVALALTLAAYAGAVSAPHWGLKLLALPLLTAMLVRIFVLQHDCGHLSLFGQRRLNDACGFVLSCFTGVAYHTWRSEHNWHHAHQGQLSHRGVDQMNSPMTREEAQADPARATQIARFVSPLRVVGGGTLSFLVLRKHHREFFHFRPSYRWPVPDRDKLVASVRWTNLGHLAVHALAIAAGGWAVWAAVLLPAVLIAGGIGCLLFWVQHNFEHSYQAPDGEWDYATAAIRGASYLKLPPVLAWVTAHIGLHHVHHLNARIPNYRLEAARRAITALASVEPLAPREWPRSFTHLFWDGAAGKMVPLEAALAAPAEPNAEAAA